MSDDSPQRTGAASSGDRGPGAAEPPRHLVGEGSEQPDNSVPGKSPAARRKRWPTISVVVFLAAFAGLAAGFLLAGGDLASQEGLLSANTAPGESDDVAAAPLDSLGDTDDWSASETNGGRNEGSRTGSSSEVVYTAITAGTDYACALRDDGTVACWGDNRLGKADPPDGEFLKVSAGRGHSCGVREDGTAACWGANRYGQSDPPGGRFLTVGVSGDRTCWLRTDGTVNCRGGPLAPNAEPPWSPGGTFDAISVSHTGICGLRSQGTAACWNGGFPPSSGQADPPLDTFTAVAAGRGHTCGLRPSGKAACWGRTDLGQNEVAPGITYTAITAGSSHSCGLRTDATIRCWGFQYGFDDSRLGLMPQGYPPDGTFTAISAGSSHTCGL